MRIVLSILFLCLLLLPIISAQALVTESHVPDEEGKGTVILLHGIARSADNLDRIQEALEKNGYGTMPVDYPSTDMGIEALADWLHENKLTDEFMTGAGTIHFVTHSMGGIVARTYLEKYRSDHIGRVVMLAPPNKGSEVADTIYKLPPYQWYYGPAGLELTTENQQQIEVDVYYELGIVAGTKEWPYLVASWLVPGESDGRVSVENTKLEGMKDHTVVNGTHTFIMDKPIVHKQVLHFLDHGEFAK
jgi:pimeloyl-ACP methyl ester carboxylesterase